MRSEELNKITKELKNESEQYISDCRNILQNAVDFLLDPFSFTKKDIWSIFDQISKAVGTIGKVDESTCKSWKEAAERLRGAINNQQRQSTINANYTVNTYQNEGDYYFRLAEDYYNGTNGQNREYKLAFDNYKIAAGYYHVEATRKLADCYRHGIGVVEKDVKQAECLEDVANALEIKRQR